MGRPAKPCEHDLKGCSDCRLARKAKRQKERWEERLLEDPGLLERERERGRKKYYDNHEAYLAKQNASYHANPRPRLAQQKRYQQNNQEKVRKQRGQVFFQDRPFALLRLATHCGLCGAPPTPKNPLVIDHDHEKVGVPNVRDPVHVLCNNMLGAAEDMKWKLYAGQVYLDKHGSVEDYLWGGGIS